MRKLFFLVFLLSSSQWLRAQVNSCPDQFKAFNTTGQEVMQFCVGQPIRFKSCLPNTQPDKEYYDFDKSNGVSFSTDTTKQIIYNRPGTYTVTQLINTGQISQKERTFVVADTPPPVFTAIACANNQVRITITDKVYDKFLVDYGDGTIQNLNRDASAIHQFSPGAALKIKVSASYTGATCIQVAEITVPAFPVPAAPVIESIKVISPGASGKLEFRLNNLQSSYFYILEQVVGANFILADTLKNPVNAALSYTINNINATNPVCFRLKITDRCGINLNLNSNTICSQPLVVTAGDNQVVLTWPLYPEGSTLESYSLYRNKTLLKTLPANTTSFTDNEIICGTQYCYELKANLKNNYGAISNEACVTANNTLPPPGGYLSSTFTPNNQVVLTFKPVNRNSLKSITYQKSANTSPFSTLASTNQTTFTDATAQPDNNKICYQAFYEDNCAKISAVSNTTCPVLLQGNLSPDGNINLEWSEYIGFAGGSSQYWVERVDATGSVISSTPATGTNFRDKITTPDQQQFFRIKATSSSSSESTFSNTVTILRESDLRIPTAFSPNGDNLNDFFEIKGQVFGNFRLQILDRWGQVIFVSTNPQLGWNGRMNGQDAPVGVYVYTLTITGSNGQPTTKTGSFTLVR